MSDSAADILMITYNRAAYARRSLACLLESCDDSGRIWIWQNGSDPETMEVVHGFRHHPRVYRFHHSKENRKLRDPTNWLLSEADGEYVSKVDDDCLVPENWLNVLRRAHKDEPQLGAIGCWRFMPEDFRPALAERKIKEFRGGHKILTHPWVEGSGFLMKRECVKKVGLLREKESGITGYLTRVALAGWTNGWYYPFLWQEHMDDPRAPHTLIRTDDDLQRYLPLSAKNFGANSVEAWDAQLRRSAERLQRLPSDPRYYAPWRAVLRRRVQRLFPSFGSGV